MYHSIQDLSENLDKKVDEKTIEYNKLLSRQKEFISIISHEIKAPVANAIFQADSMLDDINNGELSKEWMVSEMNILNEQLARMGELTSRLFSMQYFETRDVKLFRESIHIGNLLKCEVGDYARANKDIKFISEFDELEDSTKFISVDKIQFKQVISNLLQNAIKFSNKRGSSKIIVSAGISSDNLHVSIEDGGEGFK